MREASESGQFRRKWRPEMWFRRDFFGFPFDLETDNRENGSPREAGKSMSSADWHGPQQGCRSWPGLSAPDGWVGSVASGTSCQGRSEGDGIESAGILTRFWRQAFRNRLQRVARGRLTLVDRWGSESAGVVSPASPIDVQLCVHDAAFYGQVATGGIIGAVPRGRTWAKLTLLPEIG